MQLHFNAYVSLQLGRVGRKARAHYAQIPTAQQCSLIKEQLEGAGGNGPVAGYH